MKTSISYGPMLNAYPDSIGGTLSDITAFLDKQELKDTFSSFYILPSLFNTDLDRGFSVISYDLNRELAREEDIQKLKDLGLDLKLDFILNHASVLSEQFQDILKKGDDSEYRDFFIDWNRFWEGHGTMTEEGYIQPDPELIKNMFFRKPGLPILMVRFPDGKEVPYWNTFYQEVKYPKVDAQDLMSLIDLQYYGADQIAQAVNHCTENGISLKELDLGSLNAYRDAVIDYIESRRKYLGQMDLNIRSEKVWEYYDAILQRLAAYGASIVRLDAFAYAPKEVGERNFLNEPGTWELLDKVRQLADKYGLTLLPEIHASYGEKTYELVASKGYMVYDFFLPGLIIDTLEKKNGAVLGQWAQEILDKGIQTVNMLGCHDGIPLLDLKGLLPEEEIQELIDTVVARGGFVKNLHGQKNVYYQVNATYYSALGETDSAMLVARALQLFMPGKPQVWYLDLLKGRNDHEAVLRAGVGGHKEINRTNILPSEIDEKLADPCVQQQLQMLRFRKTFPAFSPEANITVTSEGSTMNFTWKVQEEETEYSASLTVDLARQEFLMTGTKKQGENEEVVFSLH